MRGHDAYRGTQAFQRPSRNAAFESRLVVVWGERKSFVLYPLISFHQTLCSGLQSVETCSVEVEEIPLDCHSVHSIALLKPAMGCLLEWRGDSFCEESPRCRRPAS